MLRIAVLSLHTCPLAPPGGKETGGMNVYIRETSRHLSRLGIGVDVFTRLQDPALPRIVPMDSRARVVHIQAGPTYRCDKYLMGDHIEEFVEGVDRFQAEEGTSYDLIHSHYWLSGWAALALKKTWQVPVIHMNHTLGWVTNLVAGPRGEKERTIRIELERSVTQSVDRIVAASPLEKAQLVWFYGAPPERVNVIPCGVDLERFRPMGKEEARRAIGLDGGMWILYVGRIHPIKGIETLIEALKVLTDRFGFRKDRLRLLAIGGERLDGDGELRRLKALSKRLGVNGMVHFWGSRRHEDLPMYYNAADVLVVPSRHESFGMVVLEAMACGTPVIASRVGGMIHTIRNNETGFHVPHGDPYGLAQRLSFILNNGDIRRRFSQRGIDQVQSYGWSKVVKRLRDLYLLVLSHARSFQWEDVDEGI